MLLVPTNSVRSQARIIHYYYYYLHYKQQHEFHLMEYPDSWLESIHGEKTHTTA